jgi:hypothetical protein
VRAVVDASQWQLESVPRVHLAQEVALAEAQGSELPAVQAPQQAPVQLPEGATPALVSGKRLPAMLCIVAAGCGLPALVWLAAAHPPPALAAAALACRWVRLCWRPSLRGASSTC